MADADSCSPLASVSAAVVVNAYTQVFSTLGQTLKSGDPCHMATEHRFTGLLKLSIPDTDPAH